jgi:hypothetical protein
MLGGQYNDATGHRRVVQLILDGTVVRVRLDRKATSRAPSRRTQKPSTHFLKQHAW